MKKIKSICSLLSFLMILAIAGNSQSITISKTSGDPTDVCNAKEYNYTATVTGVPNGANYEVTWNATNGTTSNTGIAGATVKWAAVSTTNGNIGTVSAKLKYGTDSNGNPNYYNSNSVGVIIKSIKHIKTELPMYPSGGTLTIEPCHSGTIYLEAANMTVPGTGSINPDRVYDFKWLVPSGWNVGGTVSNGSSWIYNAQNVTVSYPASATEGTIKVQGSVTVQGCTTETQTSLETDAVTVKRDVNLTLNANKSYLVCGDTSPITFTVTPALSCAVYYWNNSQTPSANNNFQITPSGLTDVIATVNIVYGGKTKPMSKTIPCLLFPPNIVPEIIGSGYLGSNNESYTISNLRAGYSVSWNGSSILTRVSNQVSHPGIFNHTGVGSGWIEATITTPCGNYPTTLHKDVWAGAPSTPTAITGFCCEGKVFGFGSDCQFQVENNPLQNITNSNWVVIGGTITSGQGTNCISVTTNNTEGVFKVRVRLTNPSGTTNYFGRNGSLSEEGGATLIISPNPATSETTLELVSNNKEALTVNSEWVLEINDAMRGVKIKSQKVKGNKQTISTIGWKNGVYVVRAKLGNKIISGKLLVNP